MRRQATAAATNGVVGLGLMMLTLTHSAHGTMIVTGCDTWEAWAMSAGIDLAYVTLKLTLLTASDRVRKQVGRIAETAIVGTLIGSAAMNIFAFTSGATSIYAMVAGARCEPFNTLKFRRGRQWATSIVIQIPRCLASRINRIGRPCHVPPR
jgi:hypothetical protein